MRNETEIERAGARRLSDLDRLASEILETPDAEAAAAREAIKQHLADHAKLCQSMEIAAWH